MIRLALVLLLSLPGLAAAQVYKCAGKSGETVYSQAPCSQGAQPHVLRSGQLAGSNLRLDRQCMDQARASIYAATNDRIAHMEQQIKLLQQSANNGPQIRQLHQQITAENANANRLTQAARSDCMREREPEPDAPPAPQTSQADT